MTYLYKTFPVITVMTIFLTSCASSEMVSERSVEYLNKKYNEKFKVVSVDMNHDEGNWGSADLIVSPESDSTLRFSAVYDYSGEKLTWENYKGAIWNREIGKEAEAMINPGKSKIKVIGRITAKGSITLNSMDLPFTRNYNEIIPLLDKPAVSFDIDIFSQEECTERLRLYENLISAAENFRGKGFRKVMLSVNIFCGDKKDKADQTLRFKLTNGQPVPGVNAISKLMLKKGESPVDAKASSIYGEARKFHESGNADKALQLYMQIVRSYDNPYRYDPYAPIESGFFIESAFYAAGIENEKGNIARAEKLYKLVADRISYFEVKAEFIEMEKEAEKYLEKNRQQ